MKKLVRLFFLIAFMITCILTAPQAFALYHQVEGGKIYTEVLNSIGGIDSEMITCSIEPFSENFVDSVLDQLNHAKSHLNIALQYNPRLSQADLLLGRIYCLLGDPENALDYFHVYTKLRPDNPLGHLETGLAYVMMYYQRIKADDFSYSVNADYDQFVGYSMGDLEGKTLIEWQLSGVGAEQFFSAGNDCYKNEQYDCATKYYQSGAIAAHREELSQSIQFRWIIAEILAGFRDLAIVPDSPEKFVYALGLKTKIEGEELRWNKSSSHWGIDYGDFLAKFPDGDSSSGVMWWDGIAVALVQLDNPKKYIITVRARHSIEEQGHLQLERNLIPITSFYIGQNWNEFQTDIYLPAGMHVIGVRYVENVGDAIIDWILFEQQDN